MQTEWRAKQKIIFLLSIPRYSLCSARLKIMHVLLSVAKKPSGEQSKKPTFYFQIYDKNVVGEFHVLQLFLYFCRRKHKCLIMRKNNRVSRIEQMERRFDAARAVVDEMDAALQRYAEAEKDIEALAEYYDGGQWRSDFEADEAGLLPATLKRGVLSEDGLWNLLADDKEMRRRMDEMTREK